MPVEIGHGWTIGPGWTIGGQESPPTLIVTQDDDSITTQSDDNLITEN
jgi:hypothetical protein